MEIMRIDYLVIGGGVAGLRAAIELARHGQVMIITKDETQESCTEYAQGGVAVALSDEDEVGIHLSDTIRAGDGLCRQEAVKVLVEEGPERIQELIYWGAEFDMNGSRLAFTREAAHSKKRILHAGGDSTGREILRVLINKIIASPNITRLAFSSALELVVVDGICTGAIILAQDGPLEIQARAVILATGGAGQVYSRTTNPAVATGDGIALAYRAGALLQDMEFVQFHPTALYLPGAPHFLLSEAMRGEGAFLKDLSGHIFMHKYHQDAELAPRDIVSRAIHNELLETGSSHVYLDLTHLNHEFVKGRFPRIYNTCLKYGLDITKDRIPVSPAAHYMMGGVKTDLDGLTNIPGLSAAGEVACTGVHGANRLASNSLLEGLVFGYRAGAAAADFAMHAPGSREPFVRSDTAPYSPDDLARAKAALRRSMWENVGIARSAAGLDEAYALFESMGALDTMAADSRPLSELYNLLTVAIMITKAALFREGSIGAHYRTDFPERGNSWNRHTCLQKIGDEVGITWA